MKKLKYSLTILSLTIMIFSFNIPGHSILNQNQECWENTMTSSEDEIRCVVRDSEGNKLAACWFCDCDRLEIIIFEGLMSQ